MIAKTNRKSVKKGLKLSNIFGDLPDMLKQQVLEFATPSKEVFFLGYSPKTKTFIKQINKSYMKETLEYKINNPPVEDIVDGMNRLVITPPKIPCYELYFNTGGLGYRNYIIVMHSKYARLDTILNRKCRKSNTKIMSKYYINDGIQILLTL
jgi:hypothetical protein